MSLRTRLVLPAIVSALALLAGCGGTGNPVVTPPPSGGFANSNLSGTYVFSVTGTDTNGNFITMVGTFNADGKGNISSTGGVIDVNGTAGVEAAEAAITAGTYNVGADGRPTGSSSGVGAGLLTLQTASSVYTFDYVLTSSEHGLLTEFDTNGSASGTLDLESTVAQSDINGQSFAFNFTGALGFAAALCNFNPGQSVVAPFSTVGAFTLDSSGNISSGVEDQNYNCIWTGPPNLTVTSGSVALGSPGKASIASMVGGNTTTYSFDVFPIDATHLKFIEMDAIAVTVGDAFTQQQPASIPSGNQVFTVAGFDNNINVGGSFTAAGILNTDGSGGITSTSVEDINDSFNPLPTVTGITGTYSALTAGRAQITLSGFVNGNMGTGCNGCVFAAYPSTGGLQLLEIDGLGITNGVAYTQAASPALVTGQGYGMNLSGIFLQSGGVTNSEDDIAEFTNSNGTLGPGIIDFNGQGTLQFKNTFQATYAADNTVPGRGTITPSNSNGYLLTTYAVDGTTTVAVSSDSSLVALGVLAEQNATAKSNAAATHLSVLRAASGAAMRSKRTTKRQRN